MSEIRRVAQKRFNEIVGLAQADDFHDIVAERRAVGLFHELMGMHTVLALSEQHDEAEFVNNLLQTILHTYQTHTYQ